MQGWHDTTQLILQILSNPAWSGVGGVCAFLSITLSILHSRRSPTQQHNTSRRIFKKNSDERHFTKYSGRRFQLLPVQLLSKKT